MDYFITIVISIIVIVCAFTLGSMYVRRNIHKEVDQLDGRKISILNRNISEEIARVKKLRMSGETEEKFEAWRRDWNEIVDTILPDIEKQLIEIEDLAGKYRVNKAKQLITWTANRVETVENQLDVIVEDIEHLVSSEQKNRAEIGEVKQQYQSLASDLLKKRGSFGESLPAIDQQMSELKAELVSFDQAMDGGSYLQARKQLLGMKNQLHELREKTKAIPKLLVQARTTIPADLRNLQQGIAQMKESGYQLEPFSFEPRLQEFQSDLDLALEDLEKLRADEASERLTLVQEQMESIYSTLEEEVLFKQKLTEQIPGLKEQIQHADAQLQQLLRETAHVQKSYLLAEEETYIQEAVQKQIADLKKQLYVIVDVTENQKQTFASISDMVEEWHTEIKKVQAEIEAGIDKLHDLRKEELKAKETIERLRAIMLESKRTLQKSNIPGVPVSSIEALNEGEEHIRQATTQLDQVPLEMEKVRELVEKAIKSVEENTILVSEIVESAHVAELLLQYSNRHRNKSEKTRRSLHDAEKHFRRFEYEEAIHCAADAVEAYEPDIVEKATKHARESA
ncbi:septation ring formation regulator EzrA [Shouchella shacheensis]|uniref:septation ring formation regulator EzrA n=1 Tax=Shouchella shacheensis TaxID=1649580 RepID=UPI0007402482|nr:septation ring formation regulator EzrA [Shouchella shacheensis]